VTIAPVFGVLLTVVSGILLRRGRWPRRVGDTPHCRKCDYILSGAQARCPECGTAVQPSTVVCGERHRRTGLTLLGGGFALLGLAVLTLLAIGVVSRLPWARIEPLGWLLNDLGGNSSRSSSAWAEIQWRADENLLSDEQQNAVVERGLKLQAAGSAPSGPGSNILDFVARRYVDNKLSPEQADAFFASALKAHADHPGEWLSTEALAKSIQGKEADWNTVAGALGAFGHRSKSRYRPETKPYERRYEHGVGRVLRMSREGRNKFLKQ
jgi:hypothetical protein